MQETVQVFGGGDDLKRIRAVEQSVEITAQRILLVRIDKPTHLLSDTDGVLESSGALLRILWRITPNHKARRRGGQ
jgi:hypothetical protein